MYGKRSRSLAADVKRIKKQLERYHPKPESPKPGKPHTLTILEPDVALQGTRLLTEAGRDAEDQIIRFLTTHVSEKDLEWSTRRRN